MKVGEGQSCTPFVSAYTDCTEENKCSGCHKCSCSAEGLWECKSVTEPCGEDDLDDDHIGMDNEMVDTALDEMLLELQKGHKEEPQDNQRVPPPLPKFNNSPLIVKVTADPVKPPSWDEISKDDDDDDMDMNVFKMLRRKRAVDENSEDKNDGNKTVIFHHTVDELNEDTLKNSNASGTIPAGKQDFMPVASRRSTPLNNSAPLQIQYTSPIQTSHAADNKVDASDIHDDQLDLLVHHKIYEITGNKSQEARDKDLSKIVVNELKGGQAEVIGDKDSPVISNITFTPENDTLTAMAFIAGNLLNKLWNMEKESEDSLETEHMKHEKINNLLDLFKEPLNLRQELFLKNALQHLSTAIETRTVGNVSLCENIEELKKKSGLIDDIKVSKPVMKSNCYSDVDKKSSETKKPDIDRATSAAAALQKITSILDLIQKYEKTQNMIKDAKNKPKLTKQRSDTDFGEDDQTTLNVFGNIIESLTKLIIPNKKSKQITKGIKNKNFLVNDKDVKDRFKTLNLTDISLSTKDKIVLDYIKHIQNNPHCLLNKEEEKPLIPNIEGDILLNVAEFFKIKSMSDLLKLVNSDKKEMNMRAHTTSTESSTVQQYITETFKTTTMRSPTTTTENVNDMNRFENTKTKLKNHLKVILQDLVELQNITGKTKDGKTINIADALPCIYNLLNNKESNNIVQIGTPENNKKDNNPIAKITQVINNLKKELNSTTAQTRRTLSENVVRPKSATVWERAVKTMSNKLKKTRRNLRNDSPKSINDVKTKIEKMENAGSNTYKSIAYFAEIPPAERLLLLKTIAADTNKYIYLLNDIKDIVETKNDIPVDDYKTFLEFIENSNININLNEKLINKINKPIKNVTKQTNRDSKITKTLKIFNVEEKKETNKATGEIVKLTRDQIINQLIRNRMMFYLKMKNGAVDRKGIINTMLAKKILFYLEMGNDNLARDLFKIFVLQNRNNFNTPINKVAEAVASEPKTQAIEEERRVERRRVPQMPVPLIQFENAKASDREPWLNQEQLMKQLMNIKNMKI